MLKMIFLQLLIGLSFGIAANAENWEKVGDVNSKFKGIVNKVGKQAAVKQKDVVEAFENYDYEVYIDTDSIRNVVDDKRNALHKVVFVEEHDLAGTDKKFKYILAELSFHCALDAIWFINGRVYDKEGTHLRDGQTVYVAVASSKLPNTSLDRLMWEKICLHEKAK